MKFDPRITPIKNNLAASAYKSIVKRVKYSKGKKCYYDQIVSEIKNTCEYNKIMKHSSAKNGSVNFTTYKCPGSKYKGYLGFAQIDGNGVIQLFPK